MSHNSSKKENSLGSGDKKTKPTHHFVHSPNCPKFKQDTINLKKTHFGNDKEVFSIPPESLDRFPKKHHHKKKKQQNNNVNTEISKKIRQDDLNRTLKKRKSLKLNDKPENNTIDGLNKYFSFESNHPKDIKERIHHNNKEISQKTSDFHIKEYLWNFFDVFKTQNDPKSINVVYSRSPRKETEDIIKRYKTREHRNKRIEDMYCDTLKGGVLIKNTGDGSKRNFVKRYGVDEDMVHQVDKVLKHNCRKHRNIDDNGRNDKIKEKILEKIKSNQHYSNSSLKNQTKLPIDSKILGKITKFDSFDDRVGKSEKTLVADSELINLKNNEIETNLMRNKKRKHCISVGVSAKSLYTMDATSQMSNPKIKCLTEIHHPVIEISPKFRPTSSTTTEKHQDDFKEMSRNASVRQSKIPVSPGREPYRSDNEKIDPENLCISTNDGSGFERTKTEGETIENIHLKTPTFVSRESSSPESFKKFKLPSKKRQQPSSFASDTISDQLPSKKTTLLLTKSYRQPEKVNLLERQKQYSENLRRKNLKPNLKVPPQVIELRYLTDLTRRSCSSVDKLTKNWLEENHEHYDDELRKEHLEMLERKQTNTDQSVVLDLQEKQNRKKEQKKIKTVDAEDETQLPKGCELKIKDNTFKINFQNQTKIHIYPKKNLKSKRLNLKKYPKVNDKCSLKKSKTLINMGTENEKALLEKNSHHLEAKVSKTKRGQKLSKSNVNSKNNEEFDEKLLEFEKSLDEILQENFEFINKDFSGISDSKFNKTVDDKNFGSDETFSLTTINQTITSLGMQNEDKSFIDYSSVIDNSTESSYVTLKSVEDLFNQRNTESLLKPNRESSLKLLQEIESSSFISLEAKDFDASSPYLDGSDGFNTRVSSENILDLVDFNDSRPMEKPHNEEATTNEENIIEVSLESLQNQ